MALQAYIAGIGIKMCIRDSGLAFVPKEFKLPGFGSYGRETGGVMLSVTGLNHFYYVRDFTDMRLSLIHI